MTVMVQKILAALDARLANLRKQLDRRGGRGIELADEIDRLSYAADALRGDLHCPHCAARLTSGRN